MIEKEDLKLKSKDIYCIDMKWIKVKIDEFHRERDKYAGTEEFEKWNNLLVIMNYFRNQLKPIRPLLSDAFRAGEESENDRLRGEFKIAPTEDQYLLKKFKL